MFEFIQIAAFICIVGAIIFYASWLLLQKMRNRGTKFSDFREWVKNVFEAIMGL